MMQEMTREIKEHSETASGRIYQTLDYEGGRASKLMSVSQGEFNLVSIR